MLRWRNAKLFACRGCSHALAQCWEEGQTWRETRRLFSSSAMRWWQFALGGAVEMERIECFREIFQWRNPKVLVVDGRDAAVVFHVEQQITTNSATQQHSFIISWFPWSGVQAQRAGSSAQALTRRQLGADWGCGLTGGSAGKRPTSKLPQVLGRIHLLAICSAEISVFFPAVRGSPTVPWQIWQLTSLKLARESLSLQPAGWSLI